LRRLWRQLIQDYLIAAIQNVRILVANQNGQKGAAAVMKFNNFAAKLSPNWSI
jgi:hypothetical protein